MDLGVISAVLQVLGSKALGWGWGIWRQLMQVKQGSQPWPRVGITCGAFNTRPHPHQKPWPHP